MDRRTFIASGAAIAASSSGENSIAAPAPGSREIYELRTLTFADKDKMKRYSAYLNDAYFPAVHRLGHGIAGGFVQADKPDSLVIYVLTSFTNANAWVGFDARLYADEQYRKAGTAVLDLSPDDPPYTHSESQVMASFASWPHMRTPKQTAGNQSRVFELRTYESHSRKANLKKIEMFDNGETGIFDRCGFQPVFFGETLAGPQTPNLTYMVTYPSVDARDGFWKAFMADPEKAKLFAIPEYADKLIVSRIRSTFLFPLPGSML
jgi:NIPSNAP